MPTPRTPTTNSGKRRRSAPPKSPIGFTDPHVLLALQYIDDVLTGAIPACKYVRQACQRQRVDLERFKGHAIYYFDQEHAGRACRFIERLPHIKGPKANAAELIKLEGWQCFAITTTFGWRRRDTGGRRFRRAYVEVPRGNGKSALSSGIALYGLTSDGEEGAEVYSAATTREQARIVWAVAKQMMEKRPTFMGKLGVVTNQHAILQPKSNSKFVPMSREAKNEDGANVHIGIVDELHAHRTREVYDVLETATSKRLASLLWIITTAGTDTSGICYEIRSYVVRLLDGAVDDDSQFGVIYTIDEDDDWTSPAVWRKANPNWGVSVMPDAFEALARKAMQLPAAQNNFKTKHLDVWCNADQAWMDLRAWDRCADPELDADDFAKDPCFAGLDLASKVDIAARVKLFKRRLPRSREAIEADKDRQAQAVAAMHTGERPMESAPPLAPGVAGDGVPLTEDHYYLFLDCYLPEVAIQDGRNAQYSGWEVEGRLHTTPGDVIDFDAIKADLLEDRGRFALREIAYDPWQATQLAQELAKEGAPMVEVRATVQNFSAPMKEFDALVRSGRLHHDGNPVLRWMVSNVVCHTDAKDNIYPRKERIELKIDGVIAAIMALGRAMVFEEKQSAYDSRGLRFL